MKAIRTRYIAATNVKPSRIRATDGDSNTVTITYNTDLDTDDAHKLAATTLCEKMKWSTDLIGGGFKNDSYWVFRD